MRKKRHGERPGKPRSRVSATTPIHAAAPHRVKPSRELFRRPPREVSFGCSNQHSELLHLRFTQNGIDVANTGQVNISDTVVSNNLGGIHISTNGAGRMLAALLRVQMNDNGSFGLSADGSGGTGALSVSVTDSQASNSNNGIGASGTLSGAGVIINRSAIVNNAASGLVTGPNGVIVVGNSTIGGNGTGVNATGGGAIVTNGNNSLVGNFTGAGTFSGPSPLQ
jgi:hypothetical protein